MVRAPRALLLKSFAAELLALGDTRAQCRLRSTGEVRSGIACRTAS